MSLKRQETRMKLTTKRSWLGNFCEGKARASIRNHKFTEGIFLRPGSCELYDSRSLKNRDRACQTHRFKNLTTRRRNFSSCRILLNLYQISFHNVAARFPRDAYFLTIKVSRRNQ